MEALLNRIWYQKHWARWLLWPLSWLFALLSGLRRLGFKLGLKASQALPVPVIIVGNITVGGSGKTPTVIYLIELLRHYGYHPGVISRGYGSGQTEPRLVPQGANPTDFGDEPAMIVARTQVPMAVGVDRIATAELLLASTEVDIIISDDGLQHYRLARDIEVVVLDASRRLGNGMLLPAGPLREGEWRLESADFVIHNGEASDTVREFGMQLIPGAVLSVAGKNQTQAPTAPMAVKAMAGIGNPERFFETLSQMGFKLEAQEVFADHQAYSLEALAPLGDELPLLMTEKDAIKCREFAKQHWWYLAVNAKLSPQFDAQLLTRVREAMASKQKANQKGQSDGV